MRIHRTRQSVVNLVILFFVIYVKRYQKKLDFILFCLLFQEYNKRFKWLLFVDMIMTLLHDEFFYSILFGDRHDDGFIIWVV